MVFLSSCSKSSEALPELKIHLSSEPATLNPSAFEDGHALKVLSNLIDPLYENDERGQLKPLSVEQTTISSNGLIYTFKIKPNLLWSDGSPVTSADFAFGIDRARLPSLGGRQQDAYQAIGSVETPDPLTLVVKLKEPCSYFLKTLTLPVSPLPKNWFDQQKAWSITMPTNGPYHVLDYKKGQWIDLKSNPHYSNLERKPKTDLVRWVIVEEEQTASQLFKSGQLDILTRVPGFEIKKLETEGVLKKDPFAATFYIGFNLKKPPANDILFRKTFTQAIDSSQIVKIIESYDQPTTNWIPPGIEGSNYKSKTKYGIPTTEKKWSAEMSFDSSQKNQTIAEFIQNQELIKSNILITLSPADWKTHLSKINTGATPVFRFARQIPFSDPIMLFDAFTSNSPNNKTGWSSKRYDALVKNISTSQDSKRRLNQINEALSILLDEERIIVPIYHYTQLHAVSKSVVGFKVNPFSVIPLYNLSKSRP